MIARLVMAALTAGGALLRLVGVRLRRGGASALLAAAGVGAAVAMLLGVGVVSALGRDAALERRLGRLPAGERVVRAATYRTEGAPAEYVRTLDPTAVRALRAVRVPGPVRRALLLQGVRAADGTVVQIVALDAPEASVGLAAGRLPRACDGRRCEAVVVAGRVPSGGLDVVGLRLTAVGRGVLGDAPLGRLDSGVVEGTLGRSQEGRYNQRGGGVRVVVRGVPAIAGLRSLETVPRTFSWWLAVPARVVHPWDAAALVRRVREARGRLSAADADASLSAPDDEIAAEQARGRAAERRLVLLAAQSAVVLLAFAAYAASRRRRSVGQELDRLRVAGARDWQLGAFVGVEAVALAAAGLLGGWLLAAAAAVAAADARDLSAERVLATSVLATTWIAVALIAWIVSLVVIAAGLRAGGDRRSRVRGRALDAAAIAALGVLVWEASVRGGVTAASLGSTGGPDPVLLLLPGLVALAAAVAAVRALPPTLRALERLARRASVALRLAVLAAARDRGRTAAAVTFLAISLATGVFALGYRASLVRGQHDQAAFEAVADIRVSERATTLTGLPNALPLERYRRLPGAAPTPVVRADAKTLGFAAGRDVQLLGVPAADLSDLSGWRPDFSPTPIATLARHLGGIGGYALAGDPVPPGARALSLPVRISGTSLSLTVIAQLADGTFELLSMGRNVEPGSVRLRGRLGRRWNGARVVAVRLETPPGEGAATLTGESRLGRLTASVPGPGRRTVTDFRHGWEAQQGAVVRPDGRAGTRVLYSLRGSLRATGVRRRQAGAGQPVPAIVSPDVAAQASGGDVLLRLDSGTTITVRPVGRARLFPGTVQARGSFAVADAGRLFRAINAERPGSVLPDEVWLRLRRGADESPTLRALRSGPFRLARVTTRRGVQDALTADPLSESVVWALLVAAVLGLALGALGLALTVAAELSDESGELRELEAIGLRPRALRRQIRLRAALLAALALLFGLAGGVGLTRLITDLVAVSASATRPTPPLLAIQPWGQTALLLAAVAVLLAAAVAVQTRRAFRGPTAGRLHG